MTEKLIISGSGGQGVIFSGNLLAKAAVRAGLNVTLVPSYGAEMRGGTANCSLIISDKEIEVPIFDEPDTLICLNEASLKRFERTITPKGIMVLNSSEIKDSPSRKDLSVVSISASELAKQAGSGKIVNMPFIGAYIGVKRIFDFNIILATIGDVVSEHYKKFLDVNVKALKLGYDAISDLGDKLPFIKNDK